MVAVGIATYRYCTSTIAHFYAYKFLALHPSKEGDSLRSYSFFLEGDIYIYKYNMYIYILCLCTYSLLSCALLIIIYVARCYHAGDLRHSVKALLVHSIRYDDLMHGYHHTLLHYECARLSM